MTTGQRLMHANEVVTDASLVRKLLADQFPQWASLLIKRVPSAGTDNAIYRLGDDLAIRLPRIHWATFQIEKEFRWLPQLAPHLPLAIPKPLIRGKPAHGYPYEWAIYEWVSGENVTVDGMVDACESAEKLAHFLLALQSIEAVDELPAAEYNRRGISLKFRDKDTRNAIAQMGDMIDQKAALNVWEAALEADEWTGKPVWLHGDMLIGNVLFESGRLKAVIDFGGLAIGDPTCDLMIAWSLFTGVSRDVFRQSLNINDAIWLRGRGHALSQAVIFIPYYLHTNPIGVRYAQHMLTEILG